MQRHYMPRSGRFGTHPIVLAIHQFAVAFLTANATTRFDFGGYFKRAAIAGCMVSCSTVPADADGTILATLLKRNGATITTLSAALNLEALVANVASPFVLLSTLTDAQLALEVGDILYVEIVSNSAAIDTQPIGLRINAVIDALQ